MCNMYEKVLAAGRRIPYYSHTKYSDTSANEDNSFRNRIR